MQRHHNDVWKPSYLPTVALVSHRISQMIDLTERRERCNPGGIEGWVDLSPIIISSHHIVDLKRQNRLKVGTGKPKLKVKMQSVSDDDFVRKRLLQKPRFELATKGVCIQTRKMLHLLVGRSRFLGQQSGKHGIRRLIAWQRPRWLGTHRDGFPVRRQSPIQVLTVLGVEQPRWSKPTCHHYTTPPLN